MRLAQRQRRRQQRRSLRASCSWRAGRAPTQLRQQQRKVLGQRRRQQRVQQRSCKVAEDAAADALLAAREALLTTRASLAARLLLERPETAESAIKKLRWSKPQTSLIDSLLAHFFLQPVEGGGGRREGRQS